MTNSGKLFSDESTEWLIKAVFIQYQCHMSICYKYALDGTKMLFYQILIVFYIGIHLNLLENCLWIL